MNMEGEDRCTHYNIMSESGVKHNNPHPLYYYWLTPVVQLMEDGIATAYIL